MTEFYQGLQATAADLLADFGTTGTLRRKTSTTPNPAKPHVVESVDDPHDIVLVADEYAIRDIDGTTVQVGDRRLYIAAEGLDVVPEPKDEVEYGGETLTIQRVSPINPAGTALLYDVHVRA